MVLRGVLVCLGCCKGVEGSLGCCKGVLGWCCGVLRVGIVGILACLGCCKGVMDVLVVFWHVWGVVMVLWTFYGCCG